MDSMDLEREKGITIQSAATYCTWNDYQVSFRPFFLGFCLFCWCGNVEEVEGIGKKVLEFWFIRLEKNWRGFSSWFCLDAREM